MTLSMLKSCAQTECLAAGVQKYPFWKEIQVSLQHSETPYKYQYPFSFQILLFWQDAMLPSGNK